ncbi:MAG TPA: hypothetical protein VHM90_18435, partial [Phycisphaerae bacterium]|nr:hypothetical protein [Phycisphaerae bacterium]
RLEAVFLPGTERHATDAIDLPRLRATVVAGNPAGAALVMEAGLEARVNWVVPQELLRRTWNIGVCTAAAISDAGFQQCLQSRRFDLIVIADFSPPRDGPVMQPLEQRFRLKPISGSPAAFALPPANG